MVTAEFFLYSDLNCDVLVHVKSRIRIEIHQLDCNGFSPGADKHQIYAQVESRYLAFESNQYCFENKDILTKGVIWYSGYLGTKLDMFPDDPRKDLSCLRSGAL